MYTMTFSFIQFHWCYHQHHMVPAASLHSLGQDNQNEVHHDLLGHVMSLTLALASSDADRVISGIIAFLRSRWSNWGAIWIFLVMWNHMLEHLMIPIALSMAHDTDANTSTSDDNKTHIIPLDNHLMRNAMVSLMTPWHHQHHLTGTMLLPCTCQKTNMPLKCYMYQLLHVHISDNYVSIYFTYKLTEVFPQTWRSIDSVNTTQACLDILPIIFNSVLLWGLLTSLINRMRNLQSKYESIVY